MKTFLKGGVALALCLLATPALADNSNGYGVGTAAAASYVYDGNSFATGFRAGQDSSGNFTVPGDRPSLQIHGCNNHTPDSGVTCTGGTSGTSGTDFNLTASTSSATRSDDGGPDYPTSTGTGSARSNLANGELGVVAISDIWRDYRLSPTYNGAQAFAYMTDTLTFAIAGADASSVTNIGIRWSLDGRLALEDLRGFATVRDQLYIGNGFAQYSGTLNGLPDVSETHFDRNWVSTNWSVNPAGNFQFEGVYALNGTSDVLGIAQYLWAAAGGSGSATYGSTSHLSFALPTNVTFTSASGTFLSATTSAVPEPATWAMMLAGFGLIGASMRRRVAIRAVSPA
mgnify:CR=1 FL=1